jgi:hypothetical protein
MLKITLTIAALTLVPVTAHAAQWYGGAGRAAAALAAAKSTNQGGYLPQGKPCGGAGCRSPQPPKLPPPPLPPWVPPKIQ